MTQSWVNAYWWMGCNYGDILTPYLIEKITGKKAVWTEVGLGLPTYMVTGSNLTCSRKNTILWGVGTIDESLPVIAPLEVRAVRGPLSRKQMLRCGHSCPEIYGDPAILLPKYYQPRSNKEYRLGIVPHHLDAAMAWQMYGKDPGVLMVSVTDPVESVIESICKCDAIISSSLHGLVTADAYRIPNLWVEFSGRVPGRACKFHDYWLGVCADPYKPMDLRSKMKIEDIVARIEPRTIRPNITALLGVCPFISGAVK